MPVIVEKGKNSVSENNQLIIITPGLRIGDFRVEPDNLMVVPGVQLYEPGKSKTHEPPTRIDEGKLEISRKSLNFAGTTTTISLPLSNVTRVQPYETDIDIYEKGCKEPHKFGWGEGVKMKCTGIPGDDGRIKTLSARIVAQFIINERSRVGNLLKIQIGVGTGKAKRNPLEQPGRTESRISA